MSNALAIAAVTATLRHHLQSAVGADVAGAGVTMVRPEAGGSGLPDVGVNVYLYRATPNAAWRNADLPTRRADGELAQRPRAALDLHYLLTFHGDEGRLEPQRLLGSVTRALHAQPVLTRQMIRDTVVEAADDPNFGFLAASDLAEEVELVRVTPGPLSVEELSRLWSVLFQSPYALSAAYDASVVLIDGHGAPRAPLPVRERRIHVVPTRGPVIDAVTPRTIVAGARLTIRGQELRGRLTRVRFATGLVAPDTVTLDQIDVTAPAGLRAGTHAIQVVHELDFGTNQEPHRGFESNGAAFVLAPRITTPAPITVARGGTLSLALEPPIGRTQRVAVLVGDRAIVLPSRPASDPEVATVVVIPIPADVPAGAFPLRVRVDGADSHLAVDNAGNSQPSVTIT